MEDTLIAEFLGKTGCTSVDIAYNYLKAYNWDVQSAIDFFQNAVNNDFNETTKKLERGISKATDNVALVLKARKQLAQQFEEEEIDEAAFEIPKFTFLLPDFSMYPIDFQNFLEKDLIEQSAMASLQAAGKLNWWVSELGTTSKLWALATTGDGNCLLHAASLSMWGFHDRLLVLRQALYRAMKGPGSETLQRRWRFQVTKTNLEVGFCYTEEQWSAEWQQVVDMASPEKRSDQKAVYESLEEIHILALAHVLRRAIVVISDTMLRDSNNEPFAPIHFGGIYIPFDCDYRMCHKIPLFLSYDMAHFSALVCMEQETERNPASPIYTMIPVVDSDGVILPIQFSVDPGPGFDWTNANIFDVKAFRDTEREHVTYLKAYLDLIDFNVCSDNDSEEEIDKRFAETLDISDEQINLFNNKNKATKQLQSLGKQFGSIGKSMSKKLKKNFDSLTKLATKSKKGVYQKMKMLCTEVQLKRTSTQMQMVNNYLTYAYHKYLMNYINDYKVTSQEDVRLKQQAIEEGPVPCVNSDCNSYGTIFTCYMCIKCYEAQRAQELSKSNAEPHYGTGKSKFYRESDQNSYEAIKSIPVSRSNLNNDQTLYLSNSTFYDDSNIPHNNNNFENACASERQLVPGNSPVNISELNANHSIEKNLFLPVNPELTDRIGSMMVYNDNDIERH